MFSMIHNILQWRLCMSKYNNEKYNYNGESRKVKNNK